MMNCCPRMSGWPRFDGLFENYPAFRREWGRYQQLVPQEGLVQSFRDNCISKEIARHIRRMEMMLEIWERLDASYDIPMQFTNELMWEIPVFPKIKDPKFKKLLDHYELLKDNIREAAKENQQDIFLILANIHKMVQALPPREEILWYEASDCVATRDHSTVSLPLRENAWYGPSPRCRGESPSWLP
jgi:hypothetical protein